MNSLKMMAISLAVLIPATAEAASKPRPRAEKFQALLACRALADPAEKFACLDRTSAALEAAANAGDLVVFDRVQVQETKKTLFGFDIPNLRLFGDDKDEGEVKSVEGKVASAIEDENGRWIVRLADGARWRQIDDAMLGLRPRSGMDVKINRGAVGTYKMTIAGQPGIKVRRSN